MTSFHVLLLLGILLLLLLPSRSFLPAAPQTLQQRLSARSLLPRAASTLNDTAVVRLSSPSPGAGRGGAPAAAISAASATVAARARAAATATATATATAAPHPLPFGQRLEEFDPAIIRCPFFRRRATDLLEGAVLCGRWLASRHKSLDLSFGLLPQRQSFVACEGDDTVEVAVLYK